MIKQIFWKEMGGGVFFFKGKTVSKVSDKSKERRIYFITKLFLLKYVQVCKERETLVCLVFIRLTPLYTHYNVCACWFIILMAENIPKIYQH